ncbi:MAG: hypothetical protein AAF221_13240 [Pseudomonadota bacterium]
MLRLLSTLVFLTVAVVCIWLAVANRDVVTVSLDPLPVVVPDVPLFFVGLAGVLVGVIGVLPGAGLKSYLLRRKLKKAEKAIATLEAERAQLMAERDELAARVRPEDERFADAQTIQMAPAGSLAGPSGQAVIPG